MRTNLENVCDINKNEESLVYSSLFTDDEALIMIDALKEYICKAKVRFSDKMKAGRVVESLAAARENPTDIRTIDLPRWMDVKKSKFDSEVEADQYASEYEVRNEAN